MLVGLTEGNVESDEVYTAAKSSHWCLLVDELTALLEVIKARVTSLKERHTEHTRWQQIANNKKEESITSGVPLRYAGAASLVLKQLMRNYSLQVSTHRMQAFAHAFSVWGSLLRHGSFTSLEKSVTIVWEERCRRSSERMLHVGFWRWKEACHRVLLERMSRLSELRFMRQESEHEDSIESIRMSELELRGIVEAYALRDQAQTTLETGRMRVLLHRKAASSMLRIIAASMSRMVTWVWMKWHIAASKGGLLRRRVTHVCNEDVELPSEHRPVSSSSLSRSPPYLHARRELEESGHAAALTPTSGNHIVEASPRVLSSAEKHKEASISPLQGRRERQYTAMLERAAQRAAECMMGDSGEENLSPHARHENIRVVRGESMERSPSCQNRHEGPMYAEQPSGRYYRRRSSSVSSSPSLTPISRRLPSSEARQGEVNKSIEKAVKLRHRLQEENSMPRSERAVTPTVVSRASSRGRGREKGALLRGLRMRLQENE